MKKRTNIDSENRLPLNLQFFAEGGDGGDSGDGNNTSDSHASEPDSNTPSYEELIAQIAQERAEKERYKNLSDKFSKEAATANKQLKEKLSAEEKLAIEKQEAEEARLAEEKAKDERIAELEMKDKIRDCTEHLMDKEVGVEMDKKTATEFAELLIKGDFNKSIPILGKHIKTIREAAIQTALENRDPIHAGNGNSGENTQANEKAIASAQRMSGVNTDILNQYRTGGK